MPESITKLRWGDGVPAILWRCGSLYILVSSGRGTRVFLKIDNNDASLAFFEQGITAWLADKDTKIKEEKFFYNRFLLKPKYHGCLLLLNNFNDAIKLIESFYFYRYDEIHKSIKFQLKTKCLKLDWWKNKIPEATRIIHSI